MKIIHLILSFSLIGCVSPKGEIPDFTKNYPKYVIDKNGDLVHIEF